MQIERIKQNHCKIMQLPNERLARVPGSRKHKFRLNAPASAEKVINLEKRYDFSIPDGYRRFIIEVGDGGAGPFYGIKQRFPGIGFRLREIEAEKYRLNSVYTKNCPKAETWQVDVIGENYEEMEGDDNELYLQGNMTIFEVGCGSEGVLVLNGPMRGKVCITDFGFSPYSFLQPPEFLDMYESWQEAVLDKNLKSNFEF